MRQPIRAEGGREVVCTMTVLSGRILSIKTDLLPESSFRSQEKFHSSSTMAAQQHPDVAASVVNERKKTVAREQVKTLNFDCYSGLAKKALKVTYKGGRRTKLFNNAADTVSKIQEYVETIGKSTPAHANLATKKSALETLRDIGETMLLGGGALGYEVRIQFQWNNCLEDTMLSIAKSMTMEEQKALMTPEFEKCSLSSKNLTRGIYGNVFEASTDVSPTLLGIDPDDEDGGDEDEECE
ncbi:unnamed protein product [Calypogeia fissa]